MLGRNLGRDGESLDHTSLRDLEVDKVDMLTLVLVGASTTRAVDTGGRHWIYTPRGYANKQAEQ